MREREREREREKQREGRGGGGGEREDMELCLSDIIFHNGHVFLGLELIWRLFSFLDIVSSF